MNSSKKKSMTPKVIQFNEILIIKDMNEKRKSLNDLITHILSDICVKTNCHNFSQLLQDLTSNLVHFMSCDDSIDKLISGFDWTQTNDNTIVNCFSQLISELINLKPFKCVQILENIIIPKFEGLAQFKNEREISSQEIVIFDKIHSLLSQIKIANFESILLRSVEKKYPLSHKLTIHRHSCYVYNLLQLYHYLNCDNREKLMAFLWDKLLSIDSELTQPKMNVDQEVFNIDDCDHINSNHNIQLLDHSMELILKFIDNKTVDSTSEESLQLFQLFGLLFNKIVLNAENCYHLQYIMFYFCSISKRFCDEFIQNLWKIGLSNDLTLNTREKALYFISSLLKNGKYVTISNVIPFMDMTSRQIHSYIDSNDTQKDVFTSDDTIFYVLCQILFEIFCWFHTEFDNSNLKRIKLMNFQRIIKCNLNPLSFCSRDIELKFILLAKHYQIGYCSLNLMKDDERVHRFPFEHLNGFDGFGSYFLPKSYTKIEPICKHSMSGHNNSMNEMERMNRYNSDESDNMIGSYKLSYSPSKTLLYNLLSDSSANEQMDFE